MSKVGNSLPTYLGYNPVAKKYHFFINLGGTRGRVLTYCTYFYLDSWQNLPGILDTTVEVPTEVVQELHDYLTGIVSYALVKPRKNSRNAAIVKLYTQAEPIEIQQPAKIPGKEAPVSKTGEVARNGRTVRGLDIPGQQQPGLVEQRRVRTGVRAAPVGDGSPAVAPSPRRRRIPDHDDVTTTSASAKSCSSKPSKPSERTVLAAVEVSSDKKLRKSKTCLPCGTGTPSDPVSKPRRGRKPLTVK